MRTTSTAEEADARVRAAEEAIAGLGRAVGALRCAGSQRLVRQGISMTHFHVLTLLRHHGAQPMGRLAEVLGASMSSATGIIDRMAERALVERVRVPDDRRVVLVRPTEAGIGLVDDAELVRSEVMRAALLRLSVDQLERVIGASIDLTAAVEQEVASAPERYLGSGPFAHEPHAAATPDDPRPAPGPRAASPSPGAAGL
jgi:DNA-binding MarR family transcriptional regulator